MSKPPLGLLMRLRTQLQNNQTEAIKTLSERSDPFQLAWCLSRFPVEDSVRVFGLLPPSFGAKVFQEMDLAKQTDILKVGRLPSLIKVVAHMESDELADLLGNLEPLLKTQWLSTLPQQELIETEILLAYPPDTAGGLMAKEYMAVPIHLTAGQVASRLQSLAADYSNIKVTYVYVVDNDGHLIGVLPIRDLVLKSKNTPVKDIMIKEVATMLDTASKREVAEVFREKNLMALPVVNAEKKLVGIITSDDVLDVIHELIQAELLKLSGVSIDESRDSSFFKIVRQRLGWLSINILLNLTAASVISFYESTIAAVIALAFFLPIISDMSGCSGMQSVAVSVRDLALNKILPRDYWQVLKIEALVGFFNGACLGFIIGLVAYLIKGIPMLGVVVGLALWINTIIAVTFGGLVPLLMKYRNFDPAIASGPILTTITDIMGFFILLSLATYWLPYLVIK